MEEVLRRRKQFREAWIGRASRTLEADDRVVAAYVTSSLAAGRGDALSDVDLYVVVSDASAMRDVVRFGEVVWTHDVPGNALPEGAYLGVGFACEESPLCTDWAWQLRAVALVPSPATVLFEREPIPRSNKTITEIVNAAHELERRESLRHYIWRMVGVTATQIARGRAASAVAMVDGALRQLDAAYEPEPLPDDRADQLAALRERLGPDAPDWAHLPIRFAERLVAAGWTSPPASQR